MLYRLIHLNPVECGASSSNSVRLLGQTLKADYATFQLSYEI